MTPDKEMPTMTGRCTIPAARPADLSIRPRLFGWVLPGQLALAAAPAALAQSHMGGGGSGGDESGGGEGQGAGHIGGHHSGEGEDDADTTTEIADTLSDGSVTGGSTGAENILHDNPGYWGVDGKVLRH